jgi:hypothetical protein
MGEIRPVIDRTYALDDIVEAHGCVDGEHKRANVVVAVTSAPQGTRSGRRGADQADCP